MMEVVTESKPSEDNWTDLLFAWTVCRHVRSNAIVLVKDGVTLGIGAGQMSRVDSVRLAIEKCRDPSATRPATVSPAARSPPTPSSRLPTARQRRSRPERLRSSSREAPSETQK